MKLTELLKDLKDASDYEEVRIVGHSQLLSFPSPQLLSDDARREVTEALDWSMRRLSLLKSAIEALRALDEDKYPDRDRQIALPEVIRELKRRLSLLGLAIAEFNPAPKATLNIGPEID